MFLVDRDQIRSNQMIRACSEAYFAKWRGTGISKKKKKNHLAVALLSRLALAVTPSGCFPLASLAERERETEGGSERWREREGEREPDGRCARQNNKRRRRLPDTILQIEFEVWRWEKVEFL